MSSTVFAPYRFNRNPLTLGRSIEQPTTELVKNTIGLWNVGMEDALKYGGELTRAALSVLDLKNDRKYVIVDTKVHMLMPGMWPAIPGWHTDGVPRGLADDPFRPENGVAPDIWMQDVASARPPRFHLLVTGLGCLTEFLAPRDVSLLIPDTPTHDLYKHITEQITQQAMERPSDFTTTRAPSCQWTHWDWWDLHRGIAATRSEWRFLIRVAETDYQEPQTDLRKALRTQQQVYVPSEAFGW